MLGESTSQQDYSAVEIEVPRRVFSVLSLIRVERKNIRGDRKKSGKSRRANSRENRNNATHDCFTVSREGRIPKNL